MSSAGQALAHTKRVRTHLGAGALAPGSHHDDHDHDDHLNHDHVDTDQEEEEEEEAVASSRRRETPSPGRAKPDGGVPASGSSSPVLSSGLRPADVWPAPKRRADEQPLAAESSADFRPPPASDTARAHHAEARGDSPAANPVAAPTSPAGQPNILLRFLVRRREAGALIGKRGSNIKRLREQFRLSQFSIPDTGNGPERVVCIATHASSLDAILADLTQLLMEKSPENDEQIELKLLINSAHAGSIIGIGGQSIKRLRNESKAAIKIYEMSCPLSNERVCAIKARPSVVANTVKLVQAILNENPLKGTVKPYDALNFDLGLVDKYGGYLPDEPTPLELTAHQHLAHQLHHQHQHQHQHQQHPFARHLQAAAAFAGKRYSIWRPNMTNREQPASDANGGGGTSSSGTDNNAPHADHLATDRQPPEVANPAPAPQQTHAGQHHITSPADRPHKRDLECDDGASSAGQLYHVTTSSTSTSNTTTTGRQRFHPYATSRAIDGHQGGRLGEPAARFGCVPPLHRVRPQLIGRPLVSVERGQQFNLLAAGQTIRPHQQPPPPSLINEIGPPFCHHTAPCLCMFMQGPSAELLAAAASPIIQQLAENLAFSRNSSFSPHKR